MRETVFPSGLLPGPANPAQLRARHRLELGDSREILPRVFARPPSVDIFFHNSLPTFERQYDGYSTLRPHLPRGGLLLTDDSLWSAAFHRFCRERRVACVGVMGGVPDAGRKAAVLRSQESVRRTFPLRAQPCRSSLSANGLVLPNRRKCVDPARFREGSTVSPGLT